MADQGTSSGTSGTSSGTDDKILSSRLLAVLKKMKPGLSGDIDQEHLKVSERIQGITLSQDDQTVVWEQQLLNMYKEVEQPQIVKGKQTQNSLFITKEEVTALLDDHSESFQFAKRKSRLCNEWDPILGRFRHWRTEHKCYKSLIAIMVICCNIFFVYSAVSYQLRNPHMHNYRINPAIKEFINNKLNINLLEGDCIFKIADGSRRFETGIFDQKPGRDESLYWIRSSFSNDYVSAMGQNASLREYVVKKKDGAIMDSSSYCIINLIITGKKDVFVTLTPGGGTTVDLSCNCNKKSRRLHLRVIAAASPTDLAEPVLTGKINECWFTSLTIAAPYIALQILDSNMKNLTVDAAKGWVDISAAKQPLRLLSTGSTKKCLKARGPLEHKGNIYKLGLDLGQEDVHMEDIFYAHINIPNGEVHISSIDYSNWKTIVEDEEQKRPFPPLKTDTFGRSSGAMHHYTLMMEGFNYTNPKSKNSTRLSPQSVVAMKSFLHKMQHPMLSLGYFDVRAPGTTNVTFFASHAMVLRLRPVFFAAVTASMMQAIKEHVKVVYSDTECMTPTMAKSCKPTSTASVMICEYPFKEVSSSTLHNGIDRDYQYSYLRKERYSEIQDYIRLTLFEPLMSQDPPPAWLEKAGYESLTIGAQENVGYTMWSMVAWPYDYALQRFVYSDPFVQTDMGLLLLVLSGGIVIVLLSTFLFGLATTLKRIEKEVIANTLFQDEEFKFDTELMGETSIEPWTKEIFDFHGKGIWVTTQWHLEQCTFCLRQCNPVSAIQYLCQSCCKQEGNPGEVETLLHQFDKTQQQVRRCCCWNVTFVSSGQDTKVKDFTAPYSKIANTLNNLMEWEDYEKADKNDIYGCCSCWFRWKFRVLCCKKVKVKPQTDAPQKEEVLNYIALSNSAKRVMNRAALVASFTDLLYFIEIIFPNVPSAKGASVSEILYDEMDHESWLVEIGVLSSQIGAPALIILPIAVFAIAWAGFETYFYMDLPQQWLEERDFYTRHSVGISLPYFEKCTGYIRPGLPLLVIFVSVALYLIIEVYNSVDSNALHGTKFEKFGYYHRLLEMRKINRHVGHRYLLLGDEDNWSKWEVCTESLSYPPPLDRKRCCWYKCCKSTQTCLKSKDLFLCRRRAPFFFFFGTLLGLLENAGLWFASSRCGQCFSCVRRLYTTRDTDAEEVDKIHVRDGHENHWREIKLKGWVNSFIGRVEKDNDSTKMSTVSFLDDKFLFDIAHMVAKLGKKIKIAQKIDIAQLIATSQKYFKAYEGDVVVYQKVYDDDVKSEEFKRELCVGVVVYCEEAANKLKLSNIGTVVELKDEIARVKPFKAIPTFLKHKIQESYKQNKGRDENGRVKLDNIKVDQVIDGRHVYPIESYWDKKENEPEYLQWQMFYRVLDNILRVLLMFFSYLVTLVTIMWCILGLFIFPERFGPYTTGIFVCLTNARVLYIRMTGYYEKLRNLVQKGLRAETLERDVLDLLDKARECNDFDYSIEIGKCSEEDEKQVINKLQRLHAVTLQLLESTITEEVSVAYLESLVSKYNGITEQLRNEFNDDELTSTLLKQLETYLGNSTCTIDDIIPHAALERVMRKFNVSTKAVIGVVVISSLSLLVLVSFLIVGMQVFTDSDPFSAGITSGLTVIAGLSLNLRSGLEAMSSNTDIQILVDKIITAYRSMQRANGISLDDKLQDVLRAERGRK